MFTGCGESDPQEEEAATPGLQPAFGRTGLLLKGRLQKRIGGLEASSPSLYTL